MLVFVDYEHPAAHDLEHGRRILAARTWITYRLEDIAGQHCHLVRYDRVDADLIRRLGATAIFVSGNSVDPGRYSEGSLAGITDLLRTTDLPVFGFCGGFQLLARSLGSPVVPLAPAAEHAADPSMIETPDGHPFEYGYHPIALTPPPAGHPLLEGLGESPVFRHAHGLYVPELPDGFTNLGSTASTEHQFAVHDARRLVGTQFHPEYWTDEHPAGRTLIANFLAWAGLAG